MRVELHDRPSRSWQPFAGAVLVGLLAVLATFQYRWLGEVRDAERERMRASLRTRAADFTQEFDAEVTRAYAAFHMSSEQLDAGEAAALKEAYGRWQSSAKIPAIVREIYLATGVQFDSAEVRRFDPARDTLEATKWPAELAASLARTHQALPRMVGTPPGPAPLMMADALDSRTPALILAVPRINRSTANGQMLFMADVKAPVRVIVLLLDAGQLQHQLLEPLVARYFGEQGGGEYALTISRRDEEGTVVFNSAPAPIDAGAADVTTGMFDLRVDQLSRFATTTVSPLPVPIGSAKLAVTIVRRGSSPEGQAVLLNANDTHGAWVVRVRHRDGSLDAVVTKSRRRNLAIGMGVLGLLAASFVLVLTSAQRQRRIARQQMEFVAAVSHELRTPLAVICSAAENLSDGVVADASQVKRYGSLIQTEGRRLGDMVERVMSFAGMSSGVVLRSLTDVDVSRVVAEAVDGVQHDAHERGVTIAVQAPDALPAVSGDADALRSAVQNVVGNAVKYSPGGATVDVNASSQNGSVQIRVADRGLGIDAADLPHIFKPFYRGRRAVDAQIRGSGVGLSLVNNVVAAHRGSVHVDSRAGEGTTVTLSLPATTSDWRPATTASS